MIGLAIGLATCILIMLYVQDNSSCDCYNQKADRIVRVSINLRLNGEDINGPTLGPSVAQNLRSEFPEVLQTTRIRNQGGGFVSYGTTSFKEDNLLYADSSFFDVFTIHFLKGIRSGRRRAKHGGTDSGNRPEILRQSGPGWEVLSFGSEKRLYGITGVVRNVPTNSHFGSICWQR
ncbi:ABC transporter permease [Spirosoma aureum]|uniref:ABC transporter permease n=1 Tax=Spirosoma aureum TaxID=2692134 RepID=A0A6G9ATL7_9BACT|nr:ABC transporter permease [Spirosoma aureum]QIP15750.1 ABC transporter permease [Spirosoma aureum]